jgi:hypothetical protein
MTRIAVLAAALAVGACAADDPEATLVALIESAEAAAEARDTGYFRDLIAASYTDSRGNDRDRIIDVIRGYFFTNPRIDVVTRIEETELLGQDAARVVMLAGILGRREGVGVLGGFDGRLYRLELELVATGGDWQIIGARWERSLDARTGD